MSIVYCILLIFETHPFEGQLRRPKYEARRQKRCFRVPKAGYLNHIHPEGLIVQGFVDEFFNRMDIKTV